MFHDDIPSEHSSEALQRAVFGRQRPSKRHMNCCAEHCDVQLSHWRGLPAKRSEAAGCASRIPRGQLHATCSECYSTRELYGSQDLSGALVLRETEVRAVVSEAATALDAVAPPHTPVARAARNALQSQQIGLADGDHCHCTRLEYRRTPHRRALLREQTV